MVSGEVLGVVCIEPNAEVWRADEGGFVLDWACHGCPRFEMAREGGVIVVCPKGMGMQLVRHLHVLSDIFPAVGVIAQGVDASFVDLSSAEAAQNGKVCRRFSDPKRAALWVAARSKAIVLSRCRQARLLGLLLHMRARA